MGIFHRWLWSDNSDTIYNNRQPTTGKVRHWLSTSSIARFLIFFLFKCWLVGWWSFSCFVVVAFLFRCWMVVGVLHPGNMVWSYQDGYRLVTVHTHGDCVVLPHWETRPLAPWPAISSPVALSWHRANQLLSYLINAEQLVRKWQISIL